MSSYHSNQVRKLTSDLVEVVAALHFSDMLELSVDGMQVRRKQPLLSLPKLARRGGGGRGNGKSRGNNRGGGKCSREDAREKKTDKI